MFLVIMSIINFAIKYGGNIYCTEFLLLHMGSLIYLLVLIWVNARHKNMMFYSLCGHYLLFTIGELVVFWFYHKRVTYATRKEDYKEMSQYFE